MTLRRERLLVLAMVVCLGGCDRAALEGAAAGVAPDASTMPRAVNVCVSCHGVTGRSPIRGYPHLDGQDETYLLTQLRAYRSGERRNASMNAVLGALSDEDLAAAAAWYAAQDRCSPTP